MTMRVYRVRPDRSRYPVSPRIVVDTPSGPQTPASPTLSSAYPPCRCPQCPTREREAG